MFELTATKLTRRFAAITVLKNIEFEIHSGQCLAITGPNGSGKTTLVRILSNLLHPSTGSVEYKREGAVVKNENRYRYIGLVGPYLELYEELTAKENLDFFAHMQNIKDSGERIDRLMKQVGLRGREEDTVKTYSSGMKQRLKYVAALLAEPEVLFVDEPRSNLDEAGIEKIYAILEKQKKEKILIIATNDKQDLRFADQIVRING